MVSYVKYKQNMLFIRLLSQLLYKGKVKGTEIAWYILTVSQYWGADTEQMMLGGMSRMPIA